MRLTIYAAIPWIVGLLTLVSTSGLADELKLPFELKPLYLDTLLVDHGRPNAVIVVADAPGYRPLATALRDQIAAKSGAKLPIVKASDLADGFGQLKGDTPKQNLILIAGPSNNSVVTYLSRQSFCSLQTDYPGKGGFIIRTIHNPWGNGANVLLLGGSDVDGAKLAVEDFARYITGGDTLRIPRIVEIERPAGPSDNGPTDDEIKAELAKQKTNFEQGQQAGVFTPISRAGSSYLRTGKEGYAKLYRDLLFLEYELMRNVKATWDSPWGPAADFLLGSVFDTWETVEESPSLSTEDRRKMTAILLEYATYYRSYWGTFGALEKAVIRNNHNTFTCLGLYKAGRYFSKYYNLPEAAEWMKLGDACFAPLLKSFKTQEDCSGYGWITTRHVCTYSTTKPDYSWFTSGKADAAGDLFIMTTDNLGNQATFGDVGGWRGNGQLALWTYLVDVERKGRYAWAIRKCNGSSEPGTAVHGVEPVEPVDLLGLQRRVTEPMFFDLYGGKSNVGQERTFDKITMRTSFDPDKPYLLLDGINYGYHGHQDANSVLRLTDLGRIWLADCDYIKSLPRYHNSMLVLRDGQTRRMPAFAECELAADLDSIGFSSTTIRDYAGTDWRRNILWDKSGGFVFIDEVIAGQPGRKEVSPIEISARCIWHALGEPKLNGNLFQVTQRGPTFSILNLDGSRMRYSDDPEMGKNWEGYKYADPVVRTLQQVQTRKLNAGERICFLNFLSTSKYGASPKGARVSECSALIGSGKDRALVGIRSGGDDIVPGLATDARVYWISANRIALGSVTSLKLNASPVFSFGSPVSIEVAPTGEAMLVTDAPVRARLAANPAQLMLDGRRLSSSPNGGMVVAEIPAGRHRISGLAVPSRFPTVLPQPGAPETQAYTIPASTKQLVEAAAPQAGEKILSLAADENGVYVGRADGTISVLHGERPWTFDAGDPVTAIWLGKLASSEPSRIAAGTSMGKLLLLDQSGNKLWDRQLPFYKVDPLVDYFTSADLTGDGNRALIVGSENWQHFAYDASGKQLWSFTSLRGSTTGTAADLDGDGREEPVICTEYNVLYALHPDGTEKWKLTRVGGPKINAVAACTITQTGKLGVVFGGAEGTIYALDAGGKGVWNHSTGDEITDMRLCDLDGDGAPEILAASRSFSLTAVRRDGSRMWRVDVGEPILSMTLADLDGDGRVEACLGTEDGHVFVVSLAGEIVASWSTEGPIRKMATLPGSPARLAVACDDGKLVLLKM